MPSNYSGNFPPAGWTIVTVGLPTLGNQSMRYYAKKLSTNYDGPARLTYDEAFKDALEGAYGYV